MANLFQVLQTCSTGSPEPSHFQAEKPELIQPVFVWDAPGFWLGSFGLSPTGLLILRTPEVNAAFHVGSQETWVALENHLPLLAAHFFFFFRFSVLQVHIYRRWWALLAYQHPWSFPPGLLSIHSLLTKYSGGNFPDQCAEPCPWACWIPCSGPHLKPVKVLPSNCTTQLGVTIKLAEDSLSPMVHMSEKGVKSDLRWIWLFTGFHPDIHPLTTLPLSVTVQPIPYPLSDPSVKAMSLWFTDKDFVHHILWLWTLFESAKSQPCVILVSHKETFLISMSLL